MDALKRKLVFGDKEQIEAIKAEERESDNTVLKAYRVTRIFSGTDTVDVKAFSKEEAKKEADCEPIDVDNIDDIDMSVEEITE